MDEKWGIDFKKLKKSSSKKLKGGLGFFLSPREEARIGGSSSTSDFLAVKKSNNWNNEDLSLQSTTETEIQHKHYVDDIPVIPSVEDFVEDDLVKQISKVPLIGVKQLASYKDLETDLLRHSAFASLDEVNLQVLIKLLHPELSLDEPDTPWTKDGLFNEMVTIFNERKS